MAGGPLGSASNAAGESGRCLRPGLSAPISTRWRSLRYRCDPYRLRSLALPARFACKDGRQVREIVSEAVPRGDADGVRAGGENWLPAVLSHCATRAPSANPLRGSSAARPRDEPRDLGLDHRAGLGPGAGHGAEAHIDLLRGEVAVGRPGHGAAVDIDLHRHAVSRRGPPHRPPERRGERPLPAPTPRSAGPARSR